MALIPEVMMGIADRQFRFERLLLNQIEPIVIRRHLMPSFQRELDPSRNHTMPADDPPSTIYTPPVLKLLSSLAKNNIMRATSSGSP